MPDVILFDCPPLSARITEKQCDSNRERAARATQQPMSKRNIRSQYKTSPFGDRITLAACLTCPGVRELVRVGLTDPPRAWGAEREQRESGGELR